MRARAVLTGGAIAMAIVAGRCVVTVRPGQPPTDVMVGGRPPIPPLKTTPTPWLRSPSPTAPPAATETPLPSPSPTP